MIGSLGTTATRTSKVLIKKITSLLAARLGLQIAYFLRFIRLFRHRLLFFHKIAGIERLALQAAILVSNVLKCE